MDTNEATPGTIQSAPHPAALLAARLTPVILALLVLVAAKFRILGDTTTPLWNRISRIRQRLSRLLEAVAQGRRPRQRKPTPARADRPRRERVKLPHPNHHGWLVAKLGWEAAAYTSQLQHVLEDPQSQSALVDAIALSPGIARNLRPLCRLLGVPLPPCLHLPPRPRPVRKPRPRKPRPPNPRPQGLLPTDRPLPAYVRAAVRAWKPRKIRPA